LALRSVREWMGTARKETEFVAEDEPYATGHRQSELLVLVAQALDRAKGARHPVRRAAHSALPAGVEGADPGLFAGGQGAGAARWRHRSVGLARDSRVPRRAPPAALADRPRRACAGAGHCR